jgi:tetratricopeptide (TPR) repeat protein
MNPLKGGRDPRTVLLLALPLLVAAGLLVRSRLPAGPADGWSINRAIRLAEDGRHSLALERFQAVLEKRPHDPQTWLRTGRELRILGRGPEAAVHFRRASELKPGDETILFELSRALWEAGLPALAVQAADSTLAVEPDHAGAWYVKAAVAASEGDAAAAVPLLDRALELEPSWTGRFRTDESFDPIRNDRRFLDAVLARRVPGLFR